METLIPAGEVIGHDMRGPVAGPIVLDQDLEVLTGLCLQGLERFPQEAPAIAYGKYDREGGRCQQRVVHKPISRP